MAVYEHDDQGIMLLDLLGGTPWLQMSYAARVTIHRVYAIDQVIMLLAKAVGKWNQGIARRCQVVHKTVARVRRSLSGQKSQMRARKVRRGGTIYQMTPSAENKTTEAEVTRRLHGFAPFA